MGDIIWRVPRFTCSSKQEWNRLLEELGVKKAFQREEADFSQMIESANLPMQVWISQVEQGAKLIVEEGGIEAAAYTYVGMEESADGAERERAEMILNRPFLYGIVKEGVYLFLGVCQNPTVEE